MNKTIEKRELLFGIVILLFVVALLISLANSAQSQTIVNEFFVGDTTQISFVQPTTTHTTGLTREPIVFLDNYSIYIRPDSLNVNWPTVPAFILSIKDNNILRVENIVLSNYYFPGKYELVVTAWSRQEFGGKESMESNLVRFEILSRPSSVPSPPIIVGFKKW